VGEEVRLRRNVVAVHGIGKLTLPQKLELMFDFFSPGPAQGGFASHAEYLQAWRSYRDRLLAECRPFSRPSAYWEIEVGFCPNCPAHGNESEQSALIRLGLPLTAVENAILAASAKSSL
jgi:hypothetical protein